MGLAEISSKSVRRLLDGSPDLIPDLQRNLKMWKSNFDVLKIRFTGSQNSGHE